MGGRIVSGLAPSAAAGAAMPSRHRSRPPAAPSQRRVAPDPGSRAWLSLLPSARARHGEVSPQGRAPTAKQAGPKAAAAAAPSPSSSTGPDGAGR